MKILDRYILSSYLKTFISVFVILMLIFVLQAIWLYIKELAGKDLDLITVAKFLFYITPTLIPLILPLTILLSSIMVFGNFAENYEFAAMKSTGISLQRAMSGLSVFIVGLAITTFFFSNNVIPWAEYNSYNLRKNIAKVKPAMAIAEGQFNQIGDNFNIKVSKKTGDRGQYLEQVVIHQSEVNKIGNYTTIIAKNGELVSEIDSNVLKLILFDGYYYNDTPPKDIQERRKEPFLKSEFEKYTMNIDLSKLNEVDLDDKAYDDKYTMLNIRDLSKTTDSLAQARQTTYTDFSTTLYKRTNIETLNLTVDTTKDLEFTGDVLDLFSAKRQVQLIEYAINSISSTTNIITSKKADLKAKTTTLNKHIIAFHEKFALAFACVILFFVGAPLGALIRKGGLGLPMIIAIVLFLSYHFIGIFAKNSAKDSSFSPVIATWFSTLIMLPLSIYLTRRATADRGLFEFDHITQPIKKWFQKKFPNNKLNKAEEETETLDGLKVTRTDITPVAISDKNRAIASSTLLNYRVVSRIALAAYSIAIVLFISFFILKNNKLPQIAISALYLSAISAVVYAIHFLKAYISYRAYTTTLHFNRHKKSPAILLIGFILFPIIYFNRRRKFKLDIA
ncbi:YjgP/YjgQ family permease [Bizionia saleffrena]|uniref:YjgP/YjgQ family permease n=2 Tax=Bizionia saleffrena TaxID=291189 RepID=A0A8H2LG26_9FLAO|nr:LptF/LptG family permease [Bizionia saleffrena]TYB73041.1 YjgP/YjgQ family permease [Bizionia saleffrena]